MMKRNLLFLLTFIVSTMTVWAQYSEESYYLTLEPNYEGCPSYPPIAVGYPYTWTLSATAFKRSGHTIEGWAESATGAAIYGANEQITLTGDLTLYAIWDDTPSVLTYTFNETSKTAELTGYNGPKPTGAFEIPATVTVDNVEYSVTSIGTYAFRNCSDLTSITIPNSVTSIGEYVFELCSNLTTISVDNDNIYYSSADGVLFNKDKTTLVTCPEGKAESYTIPNSVTSIGNNAFRGCSGLTSVTISNSVTSIGGNAFDGCTGLTSVTIGNSLKSIGDYAFNHCTDLTSITIPNSVTTIGGNAFWSCTGLTSVTIGNSVTSIKSCAFAECSGLTSVTIGNSVTSIEEFAFIQCTKLSSVYVLATTPPVLGKDAFVDNATGRKIYVPNVDTYTGTAGWSSYSTDIEPIISNSGTCGTNVTWTLYKNGLLVINGSGAMTDYVSTTDVPWNNYKASITFVEIGSSVTSIGDLAFESCSGLTSITIPNSVKSIGEGAFEGCTGLTSVTIPNSVTSIGDCAFKECKGLTSVTIPNGLTSIKDGVFSGCEALTSVTIPNSVTYIGHFAFSSCTNLTSVTIYAPSLTDYCIGVFDNNASTRKIYVFNDCVDDYESYWGNYASAIEPITEVAVNGVSANQNPESVADYWCTYYHPAANVKINTTGVEIYKAKINDNKTSVTLEKVEGNVIKAGQAVMLKAPVSTADALSMELTPNTVTGDYTDNDLKGGTTVETGYTAYTLAAKNSKMGFYKFTGTALNGNKAHLELPTTAASRAFIGFDAETTKIVNTNRTNDTNKGDGQIYDLQGRKVQQPVRGIYVKNGKKIVVK